MQTKVARRYAAALYASVSQQNQVVAVMDQLEKLAALWSDSPELRKVLGSHQVKYPSKVKILKAVTGEMGLLPPLVNLAYLLLDKGRLAALPALLQEFVSIADRATGRIRAHCYSAQPLSGLQVGQLQQKLLKISGAKDVLLTLEIDPTLLAGIIVDMDGKRIDGSLRGRLQRLQRNLAP